MGYIYKITNRVNQKVYIGQTTQHYTHRWSNHTSESVYKKDDYPLYRGFNKYGLDNFDFEVLEECRNDILDEREIFYIEKFDSYKNGYNATLGGAGTKYLTKERIDDIVEVYIKTKSQAETARYFGYASHESIRKILEANNIKKITTRKEAVSKRIKWIDKGIVFSSITECALFLVESKISPNFHAAEVGINRVLKGYKKHYKKMIFAYV
jgi:group I intron endonuclease